MEMQQMMESLLVKIDVNQAKTDASQAKMDDTLKEMLAK
jgi:hypothetical protein